jgi:hypothetical protein
MQFAVQGELYEPRPEPHCPKGNLETAFLARIQSSSRRFARFLSGLYERELAKPELFNTTILHKLIPKLFYNIRGLKATEALHNGMPAEQSHGLWPKKVVLFR